MKKLLTLCGVAALVLSLTTAVNPAEARPLTRTTPTPLVSLERIAQVGGLTLVRSAESTAATSTAEVVQGAASSIDFNGDGWREVIVNGCVSCGAVGVSAPAYVEVRDGLTGAALMRYDGAATVVGGVGLAVGPDGNGPGLLVETISLESTAVANVYKLTTRIAALNNDGSLAWTRTERGVYGIVVLTNLVLATAADALPGPATDVVLATHNWSLVAATTTARTLDGATGEVVASTPPVPSTEQLDPVIVPGDLTGDGLADTVIVGDGTKEGLHAHRGTDGSLLWRYASKASTGFRGLSATADTNGDEAPDLLAQPWASDPHDVELISGADGDSLWFAEDEYGVEIGDVDQDGLTDILGIEVGSDEASSFARYTARRGDGSEIWSADYVVPRSPGGYHSESLTPEAPDMDGDGVRDAAHYLSTGVGSSMALVSGRTGEKLADHIPGSPCDCDLDAVPGADAAYARPDNGIVRIHANNGLSLQALWSSSVVAPGIADGYAETRVLNDTAGDNLLVYGTEQYGQPDAGFVAVLDGQTGAVRWKI